MAKQDAAELAIVGTGHQAIAQVAAVAAVRTLSRVRVHSRDTERRRDFAKRVGDVLGLDTTVHNTVSECIHGAPIVTLVTRATEPFLQAPDVARGAHMNAIGAIVPDRAEFDPDLLGRCSLISADDVDSVRRLSREVRQWCAVDDRRWEQVRPISEVLAGAWRRNDADDVTLFKAMGMGLSDLAIGVHCLDQARRRGMGRPVPRPSRTTPRLGGVPVTVEESRA
jgi:ornithine cyclodeaminase